ncbi:MAG: hypothetical protein Q8R17_00790 [bacterium]|nr:hypothetical protein [bacterium]
MNTITIPKPVNGHGHLRQGELFAHLVRMARRLFSHYFGMGNTKPPILLAEEAAEYKNAAHKIDEEEGFGQEFEMHPIIKLREDTTPEMVRDAIQQGFRFFKLYPKSKTTHADDGIINYFCPNLRGCYEVIATEKTPERKSAHTLWHCEHPRHVWDDSECEYAALGPFEQVYDLVPGLKMTWCHLSDTRVVPTLMDMGERVAFELAVHYAFLRENDTHGKNHHVCRPPAKLERDRKEIRRLMVSGNPKVINGLDDAPWDIDKKECESAMCGVWTLPVALPLIVRIFEEEGLLINSTVPDSLIAFTSANACRFYNLRNPKSTITLTKQDWVVPAVYLLGDTSVVPFMAGQTLHWWVKECL